MSIQNSSQHTTQHQCVQLDEIQTNDLEKAEASHVNTIKPNVLYLQQNGRAGRETRPKRKYCNQQQALKVKDRVTNPPTYSQHEHSVI